MKSILLLIIMLSNLSACSKPALLRNDIPIPIANSCISFSSDMKNKQYIHGIFSPQHQPKKDRIFYYYYLTDFINEINDCDGYQVMIIDDRVGSEFITAGKGKSYNKLFVSITVSFINQGIEYQNKQYKIESTSDVSTFLRTSQRETNDLVSQALKAGFSKLQNQIISDLFMLMNKKAQ